MSVARVTGSDPDLGPAKVVLDAAFAELEVVRSRRVSVIDHLKRTLADADRQLAELPPALTAEVGSKGDTRTRLRRLLATGPVSDDRAVAARLGWLGELSDEIRQLDSKARALANQMGALLEEHGSTLTDIYGLGPVSATEIVLRVGDPTRFETEAAFARWNGTAPVAVSSGEGDDPRAVTASTSACRAVNSSLHIVSITQSGRDPLAKAFLARKRAAGKTAARHADPTSAASPTSSSAACGPTTRPPPRPPRSPSNPQLSPSPLDKEASSCALRTGGLVVAGCAKAHLADIPWVVVVKLPCRDRR